MVTEKLCNLNEQTSIENKEVEPVQSVHMNIYQSNNYRKDLSWLHFDDEPRVQERQQVKNQQFCISVFVAYPTIPNSSLVCFRKKEVHVLQFTHALFHISFVVLYSTQSMIILLSMVGASSIHACHTNKARLSVKPGTE